ncbi:hypothetical protein PW52_12735 [Tamlana sedimentorum]|uniref:DinB-like domain-containing protein n=1 Tax=Neotamlana sedimentorum TaxID=1435349 RepID=A0A0D7W8F5_9FLAO|nr:hypothetical protein [Tamlana sedimentorum]KJD34963.1 hypothetical protein PW52_12735 [Tamlana sedimentorum]
MKKILVSLTLMCTMFSMAQEKLPYYEIPEPSKIYTAGSVAARMVDGLGFRYFWASEGLRPEDLAYKASESARTSDETIDHILSLTTSILKYLSAEEVVNSKQMASFDDKRKQTLLNLKKASDILNKTKDIALFDNNKYPFWNLINGPIADAIWHCGQLVTLRRASGNPFTTKVNLFSGKVKS